MEYLQNLIQYILAININSFNYVIYMITKNWFIIFSLVCVVIFIYFEIESKKEDIIYDERDIF